MVETKQQQEQHTVTSMSTNNTPSDTSSSHSNTSINNNRQKDWMTLSIGMGSNGHDPNFRAFLNTCPNNRNVTTHKCPIGKIQYTFTEHG
ncbi:hypothetical protein RhiirA4_454840 [Rhizophagus irregularis]|uniref:Uncharacterized protein n=1 Tax=Rhizophagus irregularis TaxID=588596 RepID=A0A2I1G3T3_9GLOM|nr:hypothetical protein RhiirA4_454840 [Rhizophagus irregularis]